MKPTSWIVTFIGAVFGVCFAAITARSIAVLAIIPRFRVSALILAIITAFLSYAAFRAATAGRTDKTSFFQGLAGGVAGALVAVAIVIGGYVMFRQGTRAYFAHPVGLSFSQLTMSRLSVALLCLGFGAGFALRLPIAEREPKQDRKLLN